MRIKEKLNQWLEENEAKYISRLQQMVRLASTQGNEKAVQEVVASYLHELNLDVKIWDLDSERLKEHPYFHSNRDQFVDSPNVVGVLKGTGGGKSIVLNGHVDVVPEGDHAQWDEDPYSGKIIGNKMYGRGVTDMKGGNTALLMAVEAVKSLEVSLKGDVIFQSVVEEESGGAGTLDAILAGYQADAAIIPEPTNLKIFPKQPGSKWFRIKVFGKTAHGGAPYLGVSAIDKAFIVNEHLKELEKIRNDRITDPLYDHTPVPIPISVGMIKGGTWPSSVPDLIELEGRIGIDPGETMEAAEQEMEAWLEKLAEKDSWFKENPVAVEWFGARWLPGKIDTDHPFLTALTENFVDVMGEDPVLEAAPWGTDGGLLTQVGNTPSVVFGPGITDLAHHPNEAIELENIVKAAKIIAATIVDWCEIDET